MRRPRWPSWPASTPPSFPPSRQAADRRAGDRHLEIRRHRPELCRPCQGNRKPDPARADLLPEGQHRLSGPNDPVEKPRESTKLDWEVEIAAIIGTRAKYVSEADALKHVAGYCICNDVSERYFQSERGGQWTKGKSHDTFGPLGPWLVTKDEVADVQKLSMWLDVNGKRRQTGSTSTMIFTMAKCIAYVSTFLTLLPGDIITTGTPPGVGAGMKPPKFLKIGDVVTLGIEGLGEQRQEIVAA